MIYKNIQDINTFSCSDNEIYLSGTDERGQEITIVLNAIEILEWLDIKYIKKLCKHQIGILQGHLDKLNKIPMDGSDTDDEALDFDFRSLFD